MISKETAKNFADGKNIAYFESSAKENLNVKEVFEFIAGKIKESNFKSNNAINIKDEKKLNGETKTCGCV